MKFIDLKEREMEKRKRGFAFKSKVLLDCLWNGQYSGYVDRLSALESIKQTHLR